MKLPTIGLCLAAAVAAILGLYLLTIGLCLAAVIAAYFYNNPMRHGSRFMMRRFVNWFPLGMTYAFLYMGRYNLVVAKIALGSLMSNEHFGLIFAAGTWVYAGSFIINGPLVDKIGGKKGILIAAFGASFANILLGLLTYLVATGRAHLSLVAPFSILYALNMYFQSYGAVSIIKVKAYWFHVRERGVFGAIFGTLISFGVYLAFDWGQGIVDVTQAIAPGHTGRLHDLARMLFAAHSGGVDATWAVFYVPAGILIFWALLDIWLIKDTPEEAGFPSFDTADASSGKMDVNYTKSELLKKVFTSPLLLLVASVEFASGIFRNGISQWYPIFAHDFKRPESEFFRLHWGWLICIFGVVGGFAAGLISDKAFQSRRGPPAAICCAVVLAASLLMASVLFTSPTTVGIAALVIVMSAVGITSMMSGTAATDYAGRKATATCSGIVDGFAYLGSGIQSISIGYISGWDWKWWPLFLAPFAVFGLYMSLKIWVFLPPATKKYIAEVEALEKMPAPVGAR